MAHASGLQAVTRSLSGLLPMAYHAPPDPRTAEREMKATSMKLGDLRATLYSLLYCFLVVVVCGGLIEADISHVVVVPVGLFALPLVTAVPFLFLLKAPKD